MIECVVPLDPCNPGQVFACIGLLELADRLCGPMEAYFRDHGHGFVLVGGTTNPVEVCLRFIVEAEIEEINSFMPAEKIKDKQNKKDMAAPILLKKCETIFRVDHWEEVRWADYSRRDPMKLYSGNRIAFDIAVSMKKAISEIATAQNSGLINDPFNAGVAMTGRFNFDPRSGWTSLEMGFSPNEHKYKGSRFKNGVLTFPVVEMFAAFGMQYARPCSVDGPRYRYQIWTNPLPPIIARAVLGCAFRMPGMYSFVFDFTLAGQGNKVLRFAQKEDNDDD